MQAKGQLFFSMVLTYATVCNTPIKFILVTIVDVTFKGGLEPSESSQNIFLSKL